MALVYKPRPKMHSWTPPAPPKPKRSHFFLWAVLGWLSATAIGFVWFSTQPESSEAERDDVATVRPSSQSQGRGHEEGGEEGRGDEKQRPVETRVAGSSAPAAPPPAQPGERERSAPTVNEPILPCEDFLKQAGEAEQRLPMHLGRSGLDVFIGANDWAKPCRSNRRRTVALCVAIRDGVVLGLTARTSPPNLTLENCLREQAAKLSLQPESTLRVIRTTLAL